MKSILIIGAGGHGNVVAEIAEDVGYEKIAFIDDYSQEAIGKLSEIEKFANQYSDAFVGIGDNRLRSGLLKELLALGYQIPVLIHPTAYVSRTATVGKGTVVEPKAIINANSHIGDGCIISVGSTIDHDVEVGNCCHINAGAVLMAGGRIESFEKVEAGQIVSGYEKLRVTN